jgi:uncharacterized protein (UPF0216 family)
LSENKLRVANGKRYMEPLVYEVLGKDGELMERRSLKVDRLALAEIVGTLTTLVTAITVLARLLFT